MRRVNHNTSALTASLQSELPTLRTEARRLIADAMKKHPNQEDAARALGTHGRALRRMLITIPKSKRPKAKR